MSLPTGGLVARSTINRASRISRIGTLALLACAWTSASSPATAQTYFGASDSGFTAFADNGAPLANPDIAVGPIYVVAVASGEIAWYEKVSQTPESIQLWGESGLWPSIEDPAKIRDVQVLWNANSGKFFVSALGTDEDDQTNIYIAISNTLDPSDGWFVRRDPSGNIEHFSVGIYGDGIYASYDYSGTEGSWYYKATYAQLLDLNRHHFLGGQLSDDPRHFASNVSSGAGDDRMILSSAEVGTINRLRIVGKNPAWSGGPRISAWIDIPWQSSPPQIIQPGSVPLDIGGMDFRSAKVVDDSCWLAQTIQRDDHAIVRWYEIDLNGWPNTGQAPSLAQSGDIDLGPGVHAFLPDIAVDSDGNAAIVFSLSSVNQEIAIARAVRFATDPQGEFRPHRIIKQSASVETNGVWGDYVGIEADPSTPGIFWSHAPYHDNEWKTWISKMTLVEDNIPPSDGPRLDTPDNGFINNIIPVLRWDFNDLVSGFRIHVSSSSNFVDTVYTSGLILGNSHQIPDGVLDCNTRYYWRVIAETSHGDMMSNPESRWFERRMLQDLNLDGIVDSADLGMFLSVFNTSEPIADFNSDGIVNSADLGSLISAFGEHCD